MTKQTRTTLDGYFETRDKPTDAQFQDFIESVPNFIDDELLSGAQQSIIAHAGGGQGSATLLVKLANTVQTCASDHDSVILPATTGGTTICIWNATAKILDVYPQSGGFIGLLGANNPLSVPATKSVLLISGGINGWTYYIQP